MFSASNGSFHAWNVFMLAQDSGAAGQAAGEGGGGGGGIVMPGNPAQSGNGAAPTPAAPGGAVAPGGQPAPQQSPFGGSFLLIIFVFLTVMIISSFMSQRRERRRREQLLGSIAKHDKVLTVGGIIGTVAEIRDDEVVLKVDENSNTRVRFARSAIQQVIKSSGNAPGGAGSQPSVEVKATNQGATKV